MSLSPRPIRRVCVFCGSSPGRDPRYAVVAEELARALVVRGQTLVYGGGSVGLMGVLADAVLAGGGEVIGVIPDVLATKELAHARVEMRVVPSMHARKALMAELSDAFVALPGGYGTLDELFEVVTWAQLGLHAKPVGLLNVAGYYDPLVRLVDHAVAERFIRREHRDLLVLAEEPETLLGLLATHLPPQLPKWIGPGET